MPRTLNKIIALVVAITMLGLTTATPLTRQERRTSASRTATVTTASPSSSATRDKIAHARRILSGAETSRVHVLGRIHKYPASYNRPWSYHLDPGTIGFFEVAIEVCDSTITYLEDHLDEAGGAFLPGAFWCPWSSRLVDEVRPS
ncbi:acid shock protein [Nonomuraea salmonea]|uniref:acid shock protein n=1 Tax=Nonomuraea salmonea TaxID=46181 RepID=UPI002FEB3D4A